MEYIRLDDHRDHRGCVVNPFQHIADTGEISNFHSFTIEPGHFRGNHLHPERNEQVLVMSGTITVDTPSGTAILDGAVPSILTIPPGMQHTFSNEGAQTAVVLCWSSSRDRDRVLDDA